MSRTPAPTRLILPVLTGAALLLIAILCAIQGGWFPRTMPSLGLTAAPISSRLVGVVLIVLENAPVLAALWLAAVGLGWPLRWALAPRLPQPWTVQTAAGLAVLLLAAWMLAWAGCLNTGSAWLLCALGDIAALIQFARLTRTSPLPSPDHTEAPAHRQITRSPHRPILPWWLTSFAAPAVGLLLVACAMPVGTLWAVEAFGYDVLSYHLQIPREWQALGAMRGLEHNVYSYLPNLVEAGYLLLTWMRGSTYDAIYTAQLFHGSMATLAALVLARAVKPWTGAIAAIVSGIVLLAVPWTLITGSMAYDEMAVLALGAAAIALAIDPACSGWRPALLAGLLAGGATLAKLTAGPMIALPVGILLLGRGAGFLQLPPQPSPILAQRFRQACLMGLAATLGGTLMLAPYLTRNTLWTGNPVFPFAADRLGRGHWSEDLVARWEAGHGLAAGTSLRQGVQSLKQHWLLNAGYGAVGGHVRQRGPAEIEAQNVARFGREGGWPILWLAVAAAAIAALTAKSTRPLASAMLMMIALQLAFWLLATHQQSRFLLLTLLPALVILGLGVDRLARPLPVTGFILGIVLVGTLTICGFTIFLSQTPQKLPPWIFVDALPSSATLGRIQPGDTIVGDHPLNHLVPRQGKVYMVADASRLLYIRRPMTYHSAFDANPLGDLIRRFHGDPIAVTAALKQTGHTHVWVHWSELSRLHATYGFDPDVTPQTLRHLASAGWQVIPLSEAPSDTVTLYALP